ncbi:MAG: L-lactate dehydrogenase [Nitrospinaceae bacterium]|nr:MAG: L-lactate dehydrogenase [Nitrospinaceae bacterium]
MRGVGTEIIFIDKKPDLALAQAEDILHATPFAFPISCRAGNYDDLENAGIVIIAAGVSQKPGETRLDLLKRNANVFADIIPKILKHSSDAILLIATNPVDVMTHLAAKISANHSDHNPRRIIGSGTILDTARFRSLLGQYLGVSSHSVHGHVLGEHGDSEVLNWSGTTVSSMPLMRFATQAGAPITKKIQMQIDDNVRRAAYRIIQGKGATWYGIAAGVTRIAQAIVNDEHTVLTCSALTPKIENVSEVSLSIPRIISAQGIKRTIYPALNKEESKALRASAEILKEAIEQLE